MKEIKVNSLQETSVLGEKIGNLLFAGSLVTLSGDLGAGKTTLTKSIGKALGVSKVINSPTFTILKTYYGKIPLYHIDAYRLEGLHQELGFEEVFEEDGLCVVEWPQYIDEQLPIERLHISIEMGEDEIRFFNLSAIGKKYEEVLEGLK